MSRVINRQNVVIVRNPDGNMWSENNIGTQVKFTPDELIVKQITFKSDGTLPGIYLLQSAQLGGAIGSFYDGCSISTDIRILARNFALNSNVDFGIYVIAANKPSLAPLAAGQLAVHLEFVQYDKSVSK